MNARRSILALAAAVVMAPALLASGGARADWPDHAIRWVVPFGPGGANDLIARAAAEAVSKRLGQPVVIENKPGAGAVIGADHVAKARPDGYTWLIGAAGVVTNSMLRTDMPYADGDLVPVGMIAVAPSVIVVNPAVPAGNLREFVAWAKAQGSGINWATAGGGSTPHFVADVHRRIRGIAVKTTRPRLEAGDTLAASGLRSLASRNSRCAP